MKVSGQAELAKLGHGLAFMLQTVGPNTDWGVTALILSDIARLRKMPDLAKQIRSCATPDSCSRKSRLVLSALAFNALDLATSVPCLT